MEGGVLANLIFGQDLENDNLSLCSPELSICLCVVLSCSLFRPFHSSLSVMQLSHLRSTCYVVNLAVFYLKESKYLIIGCL